MTDAVSKITADDFYALMHAEMPLVIKWGISIDALGDGTATVRLPYQGDLIRPGGTIMGPAMMMLGDLGVYVASTDTITLTGDIVLVRGDDVAKGGRLVIELAAGKTSLDGGDSQVNMVIVPGEGDGR